jgi:3-methyladenine DNA glycosylase AlkC
VAEALKHFFSEELVRSIARDLSKAHPAFKERAFVAACTEKLAELELTPRAFHIADAMQRFLPNPFGAAAEILLDSLGPELPTTGGNGMAPFRYLPHVFFVQKYGLDDFELSMRAQYELTKRMSAESSIRPYLQRYPERTLRRLKKWAKDPNVHVRRLVSEGTRPRLPWAPRLPAFVEDPRPVLELLELLKDDPERYVQRSVANNLNDIGKDHPDVLVATCERWSQAGTPERKYIVGHALRSLVKAGHRGALAVIGAGARPALRVSEVKIPKLVRQGEKLRFSFSLTSSAARAQELVVDYAVHFFKANGEQRPKVFKLKRIELAHGASIALASTVSFAELTTRRHYPGEHRLELLVNGVSYPLGAFTLR